MITLPGFHPPTHLSVMISFIAFPFRMCYVPQSLSSCHICIAFTLAHHYNATYHRFPINYLVTLFSY